MRDRVVWTKRSPVHARLRSARRFRQYERALLAQANIPTKTQALASHGSPEPDSFRRRSSHEPKSPHPERHHFDMAHLVARIVQIDEIGQRKVGAKRFVPGDPFIIADEVTAPIEDRPSVMDLDSQGMMRRVPVYDIDSGAVDQAVSETSVLPRQFIAPIGTPMD